MTEPDEFASFLRARREQLQPSDVGLTGGGRRRTPGLRREELATLAGVSIDYLIRLEQGRDLNPSPEVLSALANALLLTDDERLHMVKLAARGSHSSLCPEGSNADRSVALTVRALLDRLGATPAFVLGPYSDVLAWNRAWERLVTPLGMLDCDEPNLARYVFGHSSARSVYPDWERAADEQVSRLRGAAVHWGLDERLTALLDELGSLPEFEERWSRHSVEEKRRGQKTLTHPDAGDLHLAYEILALPDDGEQRLVTWLPADEATATAVADLVDEPVATSPPRLRVVGD